MRMKLMVSVALVAAMLLPVMSPALAAGGNNTGVDSRTRDSSGNWSYELTGGGSCKIEGHEVKEKLLDALGRNHRIKVKYTVTCNLGRPNANSQGRTISIFDGGRRNLFNKNQPKACLPTDCDVPVIGSPGRFDPILSVSFSRWFTVPQGRCKTVKRFVSAGLVQTSSTDGPSGVWLGPGGNTGDRVDTRVCAGRGTSTN